MPCLLDKKHFEVFKNEERYNSEPAAPSTADGVKRFEFFGQILIPP